MMTITNAKDVQERGSKCSINYFIPLDSGPVGPGEFARYEDKNSEGDEELPLGRIVDLKPRHFVERAELDDVVSEDNEQEMMILIQRYENGGESRPDSTKCSNIPRSMTEVVETPSLDWIPSASAKTLAFVFHIDDVQEGVFSGQGMEDAFFIRRTRDAEKNNIPLDRKTFEWRLNPRKKYCATAFSERVWSAHATSTDHVFRSLHTKSAWDGRTKSVSLHGPTEECPSCITCKMKKKFKYCDPLAMSLNQSRKKKTLLNDYSARYTTDSKKSQSLRIQDQAELEAFRKVAGSSFAVAPLIWPATKDEKAVLRDMDEARMLALDADSFEFESKRFQPMDAFSDMTINNSSAAVGDAVGSKQATTVNGEAEGSDRVHPLKDEEHKTRSGFAGIDLHCWRSKGGGCSAMWTVRFVKVQGKAQCVKNSLPLRLASGKPPAHFTTVVASISIVRAGLIFIYKNSRHTVVSVGDDGSATVQRRKRRHAAPNSNSNQQDEPFAMPVEEVSHLWSQTIKKNTAKNTQ